MVDSCVRKAKDVNWRYGFLWATIRNIEAVIKNPELSEARRLQKTAEYIIHAYDEEAMKLG